MKQWILKLLRRRIADAHHAFSKAQDSGNADQVYYYNGMVAGLIDTKNEIIQADLSQVATGYTIEEIKKAWEDVEFVVHYHSCPLGASEWEKARLGLGILNAVIQAITKEVLE